MAVVRYGIPLTILAVLAGMFLRFRGLSERLLTPLPKTYMTVTILIVLALAFYVAVMLARAAPSRLGRRLAVIGIMAFVLYAGGVSARGLYAQSAFSAGTVEKERWMGLRARGNDLLLTNPSRRKSIFLPASPETVAAASMGRCVEIAIERSASGDERVAAGRKIFEPSDLSPC